jgi:alpha-galactosidase
MKIKNSLIVFAVAALMPLAIMVTQAAEVYDGTFPQGVDRPILTPVPGVEPRINGASVFGVRPGSPFLFQIPATGQRPLRYTVKNLPKGLNVNIDTGLISGTAPLQEGTYPVAFEAENVHGKSERFFNIIAGDTIALTPPMGWNSWYAQSEAVSDASIRKMADAMEHFGLAQHGWSFINIDDCWSGERDAKTKAIQGNAKFPDMKGLADYIHSKGLKLGIYSTPWMSTFAGYIGGTANNEAGDYSEYYIPEAERLNVGQYFGRVPNGRNLGLYTLGSHWFIDRDAKQFAEWGVDMVKYDWRELTLVKGSNGKYIEVTGKSTDKTEAFTKRVYDDFRAVNRDIIISLSPVHTLAEDEFAPKYSNMWRLTKDIKAEWRFLKAPFDSSMVHRFSLTRPGSYGDLDMLQVGMLGTPNRANTTFRPSPLTAAEQYFQVSLWCLLNQPLLLSCDLTQLHAFTLNLITNDEVIAVDQDALGKAGTRVRNETDSYEIWSKPLADGSIAVGLFNLSTTSQVISLNAQELGLNGAYKIRDLWRQKDIATLGADFSAKVEPHGVVLVKIFKK